MNDISKKSNPRIESLYVKTFNSFAGPEYGIRQIFQKARQMAPCLLIFEDIDSLILPNVRSYFLNEVDGLESNHGILMIASTNHLERLDPGTSYNFLSSLLAKYKLVNAQGRKINPF
jgi:transitional endoplasmic reticulum ATPase